MRLLQHAVVTLFALSLSSGSAQACQCNDSPWQKRVAMSDAIFLARVVRAQPLAYVDLEVKERFKGKVADKVRIRTAESDCDYFLPPLTIEPGAAFLIYGTIGDGRVTVDRCLGSGPAKDKGEELARLRGLPNNELQRTRPAQASEPRR